MSFDTIVMWIMASGALLGAVDKVLGNRFGLGDEFKKGYETMGPLTMGMVGIVCLTPLIQKGINSTCCFANKLRKFFKQSAKKKRRLKGF